MKDIEKLLVWFIPLFILEYFIQSGMAWMLTQSMKEMSGQTSALSSLFQSTDIKPETISFYFAIMKPWLAFGTKLAVSIWLYIVSKKYATKPIVWAFFGAVTGVVSIAIFYTVLIFENQQKVIKQ